MRATLVTPRTPGAIAIIQLDGDVDQAMGLLGIERIDVGQRRLSDFCGIDRGVVVRWSDSCVQLMPHGGPAVVEGLLAEIRQRGIQLESDQASFPEASDEFVAIAMTTIANTASPAAVTRLLKQPAIWNDWDGNSPSEREIEAHSQILNRLITPPAVVAIGRPNIGKSALCNAMSSQRVALVADEAGVTRDHVGVSLRLGAGMDAVEVRWIDTPGISEDGGISDLDAKAQESAAAVFGQADCIVSCGDRESGFVDHADLPIRDGVPVIKIGLRCDLGEIPAAAVQTSALTGDGLESLANLVRGSLFPEESMDWAGPWRFAEGLPSGRKCD